MLFRSYFLEWFLIIFQFLWKLSIAVHLAYISKQILVLECFYPLPFCLYVEWYTILPLVNQAYLLNFHLIYALRIFFQRRFPPPLPIINRWFLISFALLWMRSWLNLTMIDWLEVLGKLESPCWLIFPVNGHWGVFMFLFCRIYSYKLNWLFCPQYSTRTSTRFVARPW